MLALIALKANYSSTSAALHDLHGLEDEAGSDENPSYKKLSRSCLAVLKSLGLTASLWGFFESIDSDMHPGLKAFFYSLTTLNLMGNFYANRAFASRELHKGSDVRDQLNMNDYSFEDEAEESVLSEAESYINVPNSSRPPRVSSGLKSPNTLWRDTSNIQSSASIDRIIYSGDKNIYSEEELEDVENPKDFHKTRCIVL